MKTRPTSRALRSRGARTALLLSFAMLATAATALGQQPADTRDPRGSTIDGGIGSRDNTRVYGTVYGPDGNVIPGVDLWVMNDTAPAARMRVKTRPTGVFQVRNVGRLYTQDDVYGVVLRLRFEAPGYQVLETKVPVEKDALVWSYPILWPEGETPEMDRPCVVLKGRVTNAKGKKAKDATIVVTSPDDPSLRLEVEAEKSGDYEALLWKAPSRILIEAKAPGLGEEERGIDLGSEARADMLAIVEQDFSL